MRKEIKIGGLLYVIFIVVRFFTKEILTEVPVIHFFLGIFVGLAIVEIIIGLLPEATYLKLKTIKNDYTPFAK